MSYARTFQVLACEVSLATGCDDLAGKLDYVTVDAVQWFPRSRRVAYDVERTDDSYLVREDGDVCHRAGSADEAVIALFHRMHAATYREMAGCPRLHAGCGAYAGAMFLAAGPKGAGKSTLMAKLVFEGFEVFGDEMVLGLGREVIALPRRFHLKPPALDLLPEVAAVADRLPFVLGDTGLKILAFDPTDAGRPWTIRPGTPAAIFFLEPNHAGPTTIEPCAKVVMTRLLMTQSALDGADAAAWIRSIGALVRAADCYRLHVGDLSTAASLMQATLSTAATASHPTRPH
jgi:hypothetical protein